MQVTRRSPVTGQTNTLEVNVTEQQMQEFQSGGRQRLVQEIFCDASASEREFILTGYTPEDWEMIFGDAEGDDEDCLFPKGIPSEATFPSRSKK